MSNFGVDLLLESQKANIKSPNDVLVIIMHWMLCKNDLRNVGVGDNKVYSEADRPSELLPEGWNSDNKTYTLRYSLDKQIFIFHGSTIGNSILINLLDASTLKTESLVFETEKIVKSTNGSTLDDFVNDSKSLISRMEQELIKPILTKPAPAPAIPTRRQTEPNPLLVDRRYGPISNQNNPWDIGRGDLDPLGRGGGGMIFNPPFRPGANIFPEFNPHGGPTARFDPPNPLGFYNPNNDEFLPPRIQPGGRQPPGPLPPGYDDMFM